MRDPGPLALEPILVPKPWGGKRLQELGKVPPSRTAPTLRYGESWEVADLPDDALSASERGRTLVANEPHLGKSLRRLISELGPALLGSASPTPAGDFPLLFKLLDTAENLSIQVHPDEHYASRGSGWFAKTESWYVLDAKPGATILKGLRPGVGMEDIREAAGTPALAGLMQKIPVRPGDFHHLPAGTVHALGAGVTVAEVQTPSDTTFRLYDWTAEYSRPARRLHITDALNALSLVSPDAISLPGMTGDGDRLLVRTPHYRIREHRATDHRVLLRSPQELSILAVVSGRAVLEGSGHAPVEMGTGSTAVIPAAATTDIRAMTLETVTLLEIGLG
ncbi:MAG: class I mannose-6-phosphate isomerase [bacterium]|nr:class I mannose-6-phosphate isomerase [bacterium]